jgi:hypothetical protein
VTFAEYADREFVLLHALIHGHITQAEYRKAKRSALLSYRQALA